MQLYLIRHAQSENNARPEHLRVEDPGLTELGHRQAERLAQWTVGAQLTRLITSPFRRALQTTQPVCQATGLKAEVWIDLHEQGGCYRGWQSGSYEGCPGLNRTQIEGQFAGFVVSPEIDERGWWRSQRYESDAAARSRAERLLRTTRERFAEDAEEVVGYVMHADFKRLFLATLFADDAWAERVHGPLFNAAVTCCTLTHDSVRLNFFNSATHLARDHWTH